MYYAEHGPRTDIAFATTETKAALLAFQSGFPEQMHPATYAVGAVLFVAWATFTAFNLRQQAKRKAAQCLRLPGPKLVPFIGRIHDLPIQYMWLKFKEWSDIYGPIYYTEMLGAKFVIISDEKIAEELLVKRAKFNSDRPPMRSVTDSKSTEGGMEYLPLMGKNSESASFLAEATLMDVTRILGSSAQVRPLIPH